MYKEFKRYLQGKIDLSDNQFKEIEKRLKFKNVRHGEILLQPGELSEYGYFVLKGCLRSYVIKDEKEHIVQFAPENWWIGDNFGNLVPEPAMLFIDAIEDSKVALYDKTFMPTLIEMVPEALEMKHNLEQNSFRSLQKRIIQLLGSTAAERYLSFIERYPNLATRLPQKMIASFLGIAPQSLSRVRSHFITKNSSFI